MDGSSMKLFLKNANDALDGTVLTTILVTPSVNMFSPNGQYIIYRNEADG